MISPCMRRCVRREFRWDPDKAAAVMLGYASGVSTLAALLSMIGGYGVGVAVFGVLAVLFMLATERLTVDLSEDEEDDDASDGGPGPA